MAIVAVSGPLTLSHQQRIAELLVKHRLPSMHERREEVEAGGLMSYSALDSESFPPRGVLRRQDSQGGQAG